MTRAEEPGELPLAGRRVLVTRSASQASALSERLRALGAEPLELATIAIAEPSDGGVALRAAVDRLRSYDRVVVASPNGARVLLETLATSLGEPRPAGSAGEPFPPVACVGPATAAAFNGSRLRVDLVPDRSVAEGLVDAVGTPASSSARLLLVQAEVARAVLADGLRSNGWDVERVAGYRTIDGVIDDAERAAAATADVVTFTSSSTVERFVRLVGMASLPPVVVSIGPITSTTARDHGIAVSAEADPHNLDGLVDALVRWAADRSTHGDEGPPGS
ncbi:MAG: uroporphyrinogen-III synthase [Actinomycetota bacterium]